MRFLKDIWIDLAITLLIGLAVFGEVSWAWWTVAVYTPVMALLKLAAYLNRFKRAKLKPQAVDVPEWLFHLLYAVNVGVTVYGDWWWMAGLWILIWILSALGRPDRRPKGSNA